MQEVNKKNINLQEDLNSGLYYKEMLRFYNNRYINPFIERSFLYVISIFLFILLLILLYRIYDIFPLEREVRYVVNLKNQNDRLKYKNKSVNILPQNQFFGKGATPPHDTS